MNSQDSFSRKIISLTGENLKPHILLAVSGGMDSMCLLHMFLSQTKFPIAVAHCNFQLRGSASNADQELVEEFCIKHNVRFHIQRFDTAIAAEEAGTGIQETARTLRYTWFQKLCQQHSYTHIATGHHAMDQAETILFNLLRGTGIRGMRGMLPLKEQLIRPLLQTSKGAIEDYIKQNQVPFREDASNAENTYSRNLIRNSIFPLLNQVNNQSVEHINQSANLIAELEVLVKKYAEAFKAEHTESLQNIYTIQLQPLLTSGFPTMLLHELLSPYGFNSYQLQKMLSIKHKAGQEFRSQIAIAKMNLEQITVTQQDVGGINEFDIVLPYHLNTDEISLSLEIASKTDSIDFNTKQTLYIDFEKIQACGLTIRNWQDGDKFIPLGMDHHQKLSDFFINQKIRNHNKKTSLILLSGEDIAAVIPYRISQTYRVTHGTQKLLKITFELH